MTDYQSTHYTSGNIEAVLVDDATGCEVDSWDPVTAFCETETAWIIESSYNIYEQPKKEGFTMVVREMGGES